MDAWIDRLIDLGMEADAECWRYAAPLSYLTTFRAHSNSFAHGYGKCGGGYVVYRHPQSRGDGYGAGSDGDGRGGGWRTAGNGARLHSTGEQ